jgi:hypothetical protein
MQTFSFANPPRVPGIYMLRHKPTGSVYIGKSTSLLHRWYTWRHAITHDKGISLRFRPISGEDALADWEFVVVVSGDGLDLEALEHQAVAKVLKAAPQTVVTFEGNPVTYRQAAEVLDCSGKSLAKRLLRYRGRGVTTVSVEELKALSEKYRPQKTI